MLRVFGSCCGKFETGQSFEPTFFLFRYGRSVALQCWICLHSSSKSFGATHADNTWFTKSKTRKKWVVSFPRCTAGPNIVGSLIATVCTPLLTQTKNVRRFCVRLHVASLQILKLFFLWPDWGIRNPRLWNCKFSSRNLESKFH